MVTGGCRYNVLVNRVEVVDDGSLVDDDLADLDVSVGDNMTAKHWIVFDGERGRGRWVVFVGLLQFSPWRYELMMKAEKGRLRREPFFLEANAAAAAAAAAAMSARIECEKFVAALAAASAFIMVCRFFVPTAAS
jgi:hypothetical protein